MKNFAFLATVAGLSLLSAGFQAPEKYIKPVICWHGLVQDATLRTLPKSHKSPDGYIFSVILDQKSLEKVWKQWKLGAVPEVDFDKYLVVVNTSDRLVITSLWLAKTEGGKSMKTELAQAAKKESPEKGFVYSIAVFERADIRTIEGVSVPERYTE